MDDFEKKIKDSVYSSIDENTVPDRLYEIKKAHLDYQDKPKKVPWYKKKAVYGVLTPILAAGFVFAICLPFINRQGQFSSSDIPFHPSQDKKNNDQIAFGVSSAFNYVDSSSSSALPLFGPRLTAAPKVVFEEEITILNPYMFTSEQMLRNNFDTSYEIVESPLENYVYLMIINDEIEFHYNETNFEVDDDEAEYTLEGIFVVNDSIYNVIGEKELESSQSESEYELELKVFLDASRREYLAIEQEIENEVNEIEKSYLFAHYLDNTIMQLVEINFEQESNQKEVEINIIHTPSSDDDEYDASYKINLVDESSLMSSYEIDRQYSGYMRISIEESGSESFYTYTDLETDISIN